MLLLMDLRHTLRVLRGPAARALVRETSPGSEVVATTTLARHMAEAWHHDWLLAVLGSSLAALGALLALTGLYATVSLLAGRRTREFGIRLSLGARAGDVLVLVLGQGLALALVGAAVGILALWWRPASFAASSMA